MAGILVLMLGTGLVLVSLVALWMRRQTRLLLRRLTAASRWTCSAGPAGQRLPRYVLISGRTAPGPGGPLRSPAFDVDCVWFRTSVMLADWESSPNHHRGGDSRSLLRTTADGLIGIFDGTGRAVVDLRRNAHDLGNDLVIRRAEDSALPRRGPAGDSSGLQRLDRAGLLPRRAHGLMFERPLELREEFIEPNRPITALGRPRRQRDGSLLLTQGMAISGADPDRWITDIRQDAAGLRALVLMLPIGAAVSVVGTALIAMGTLLR